MISPDLDLHELAELLQSSGQTVALAESCTGGLIAKMLTDSAGSSAYFLLGVVSYANSAKEQVLGVSPATIVAHGAVSCEVAMAMASGVRKLASSDFGVAVTGIAGPDGGTPEKPVGTVWIALADMHGCQAEQHCFPGNRQQIRELSARTALGWLKRRVPRNLSD